MLIKQQIMENFKQMVDRTTENNIGKILKYLKGCGGISKEQNEMLLRKYIEKKNKGYEIEDIIERTILIMANDGLIWYIVSQHFGGDPDMYSVAKIGMIKAIDHFSFDRDCSFASFASKVMINEVLMCKRAEKRQIETSIGVASFDAPIEDADGDGGIGYDLLASDDDFVKDVVEQEYCRYIQSLFVYLTPIEQQVMIYTFGLFGNKALKQSEVAEKIGISQSYVSRLIIKVPEKLKILLSCENGSNVQEYKKATSKTHKIVKR